MDTEDEGMQLGELSQENISLRILNEKDRNCASDFITFLEMPGPNFDEHSFFTKGILLIEGEIKEFLSVQGKGKDFPLFILTNEASAIKGVKAL